MIREMRQKECYLREIAEQVGCSERTIRRALKRGGPPARRRAGIRPSKLDPYKPLVEKLLLWNVWNSEVIFAELRAQGYTGGRSILQDTFVLSGCCVRPKERFTLKPCRAKQLQSDWGQIDTEVVGEFCRVHFAVNLLGYSRCFYVWAALCMDTEYLREFDSGL